jgi:hypothetical protein
MFKIRNYALITPMNQARFNNYNQFKSEPDITDVFNEFGIEDVICFKSKQISEKFKRQVSDEDLIEDVILGLKVHFTYDMSRVTPYLDFHSNDNSKAQFVAKAMSEGLRETAANHFGDYSLTARNR